MATLFCVVILAFAIIISILLLSLLSKDNGLKRKLDDATKRLKKFDRAVREHRERSRFGASAENDTELYQILDD